MKFGTIPLDEAVGAVLAHRTRANGHIYTKGHVLTADDVAALAKAGLSSIIAAQLETGDIAEDDAARRAATVITGSNLTAGKAFTGRVNLFAANDGLFTIARDAVDTLNRIDEAITLATLEPFTPVKTGDMVATVKIIPFAAPAAALARWEEIAKKSGAPLALSPFKAQSAALIETTLGDTKPSVIAKTIATTKARLSAINATLVWDTVVPHDEASVAKAVLDAKARGANSILIMSASAILDRRDVVPSGVVAAGGVIGHLGMPVDPGNLLLLASLPGDIPVIGLPGCARSPKVNGFDWVLERFAAGIPVTGADIMNMGVGGLLAEIPVRGQPRAVPPAKVTNGAPRIAALVLAAGLSRRMGERNKLTIPVPGSGGLKPMVAHAVDAAIAAKASPIIVVLGHEDAKVRALLSGRDVVFVANPDYAHGLSTSLRAGMRALSDGVDGAVVLLGDMPKVGGAEIEKLIAAFNPVEGRAIAVPTYLGKRGNPVLFSSAFFETMAHASGDTGAKHLIGENEDQVIEVAMDSDAVLADVDDPAALASLQKPAVG